MRCFLFLSITILIFRQSLEFCRTKQTINQRKTFQIFVNVLRLRNITKNLEKTSLLKTSFRRLCCRFTFYLILLKFLFRVLEKLLLKIRYKLLNFIGSYDARLLSFISFLTSVLQAVWERHQRVLMVLSLLVM